MSFPALRTHNFRQGFRFSWITMMFMRVQPLVVLLTLTTAVSAQTLSNASLNGKYFVRHVQFTTDANNTVTDARSIIGVFQFNGAGAYTFTSQQTVLSNSALSFSGSGTYSVTSGGAATISNPQKPSLTINARIGTEAVVGASTESAENTFDMFVAIPAPTGTLNNASLKAGFSATDFELSSVSTSQVRNSISQFSFDGAGNISGIAVQGHAAGISGGAKLNQTIPGGSYNLSPDGTGAIAFAQPSGVTPALMNSTQRVLYVSQSGNVILAGTPGAHDIFIGVKALSTPSGNTTFTGRSWTAGFRVDSSGSSANYAGSGTVINADTSVISSRRYHQTGYPAYNITAARVYTIASDGTGSIGPAKIALGSGNTIVSSNVAQQLDPTGYEISFGVAIPNVSGSGVFINPQGVVNAASNAPAGDAISPGEFIAIYGSGLAPSTTVSTPPYPASLAGVSVMIGGLPAPVYLVSSGQINCLVPYGVDVTKSSVNITLTNNGVTSNTVTVPLAKTSPGIFSNDTSGTGEGAILHAADNSLVSPSNPAKKGEILVIYLTGLGAVQKTVPDGAAPNPPAADAATTQVVVYVNGVPAATPGYAGLNPVYPGLYQINFTVPTSITVSGDLPIAIQTPDAFHDQINLSIQ